MANKLQNTQVVLDSIKNSLNLIKSTTSNSEEFQEAFRNLLVIIRLEYDKIKSTSYDLSQSDLVKVQYELVKLLAEQVGVKLTTPTKKKTSPKKVETNPKWEEVIVVSPRVELFDDERLTRQGVIEDKEVVDEILSNLTNSFISMRRGATEDSTDKSSNAEINTDYKQPIPYVLIKRANELFVYERLTQGGESRLHNKLSLGVGGHINPEEGKSFDEVLSINLKRELDEELHIESVKSDLNYLGLINDDEDEVGRVHLGILATITLDEDAVVEVKEVDQLKGEWMTIEQLKSPEVYDQLENWSKLCVDIIKEEI